MSVQNAVLGVIRVVIKTVELLSLKKATDIANHLWLRPVKIPMRPGDVATFKSADRFEVSARGQPYLVQSWGNGPVVVLVHGWDGRASQMYPFVQPLVARGYRVLAFDAPAHGDASGNQVDPPFVAELIKAIAAECGQIEAFVAHSFGSTWSLLAVRAGVSARKIALIAPPQSLRKIFDKYDRRLALSARLRQAVSERLAQIHGDLWNNYSNEVLVKAMAPVDGVVIHDDADQEIPCAEGRAVATAWEDSKFVATNGLGHYRILKSHAVIDQVVNFVAGTARQAAA
jgi:pimeloyl-ACP methyl ester carboxylesterase